MSLKDDIARTVARQEKYYDLKLMEFTHECSCGGSLSVCGNFDKLRCGKCGHVSLDARDPMVRKLKGFHQQAREGKAVHPAITQNMERAKEKRRREKEDESNSRANGTQENASTW